MASPDLKDAVAALSGAPGPAPWYATPSPLRGGDPLRWCAAFNQSIANLLIDAAGAVLFVLPRYACAQLVKPSELLCWQQLEDRIAIRLFDTNGFRDPIANSLSDLHGKGVVQSRMTWNSGLLCEVGIPCDLSAGTHKYVFPSVLKTTEELFILVTGDGTRVYQVLPRRNEVAVYPQDWFNKGNYDFGYQWLTAMVREARSKAVVGYGMRLGVFVLDSTLRNVSVWLRKDDVF
jgi:hypothetical protein